MNVVELVYQYITELVSGAVLDDNIVQFISHANYSGRLCQTHKKRTPE